MININRNNYEKYFIDFLDGALNQAEQEELFLFLETNPDLKEELEGFDAEMILDGEVLFENKNILFKKSFLGDVTCTNFDELCIASIERDLSQTEEKYFQDLLNEGHAKQNEYKLYQLTKIQPKESILFDRKTQLKKQLKPGYKWDTAIISIAASVAVLVGLYIFKPRNDDPKQEIPMAETTNSPIIDNILKESNEIENKINIEKVKPINVYLTDRNNMSYKAELKEIEVRSFENINEHKTTIEKLATLDIVIENKEKDYINDYAYIEWKRSNSIQLEKEDRYFTVGSFLASAFNERILNKKKKDKLEWFDVAQASVEGINKLTGSNMKLERKYDKNGNHGKTEFNSKLIAFSAPVKKD